MEKIHLKDDFIKLGQALKLAGLVDSGVEAKIVIQERFLSTERRSSRGERSFIRAMWYPLAERNFR